MSNNRGGEVCMVLFILAIVLFLRNLISENKKNGVMAMYISFLLMFLSLFNFSNTYYGDYSVEQLEERAVQKNTMQISDVNLKLVEERYEGTYFGDGVSRTFNEYEENVKMIKSDKIYAYMEKLKIKKEASLISYMFSIEPVVDKIIDGYETIYIIHYI